MPIEVFDYRQDIKNLVITPEIRSRFMRMEPGTISPGHTHDLGHEIFLILAGQAEFNIDGEIAVLGPGQCCFARAHQWHEVRVVGDEPMTMYLSVTPHIEPTHTLWHGREHKLPPHYGTSTRLERAARREPPAPAAEIADRFVTAARSLAAAAITNSGEQDQAATAFVRAANAGDRAAAKAAVDAMWTQLYTLFQALQQLETVWNELAPQVAEM
jgi:quercetin dioxygenase-like cupin family protein